MPTRPAETTHDDVRQSLATAEAEPEHPVEKSSLPHVGNADDPSSGDQDIDTAGTAHDDLSPTKSL